MQLENYKAKSSFHLHKWKYTTKLPPSYSTMLDYMISANMHA